MLAALAAGACTQSDHCGNCQDIVSQMPWGASETHSYVLKSGDEEKGTAILSLKQQSDQWLFTQSFSDDKGNSDESAVTADGTTLKPFTQTRTIIDSELRNVVDSQYEAVSQDECDDSKIVRIKQSTYKPPTATDPSSERSNPLCVPEHGYDNDSSLFIWRTIKFEKDYHVRYQTVLTNRRDIQNVELTVAGKAEVDVPAGHFEVWLVVVQADQRSQSAWFTTSPDHTLVKYDNDTLTFEMTH